VKPAARRARSLSLSRSTARGPGVGPMPIELDDHARLRPQGLDKEALHRDVHQRRGHTRVLAEDQEPFLELTPRQGQLG